MKLLLIFLAMFFSNICCNLATETEELELNIAEPPKLKSILTPDLPEVKMNISQVIEYYGYPCENHEVVTDDGYILTVQRIRHGRNNKNFEDKQRPVAFLQHGLLDSARTWVNNLADQSLAFILADEGFEVWLGNSRGNTYSKKHVTLDLNSKEFWNFNWDQMAEFDLPACIDYILTITGVKNISYVGHSQGTMICFAKLNEDADFAAKINSFIALGPVTTLGYIKSPIRLIAPFTSVVSLGLDLLGQGELLSNSWLISQLNKTTCKGLLTSTLICSNSLFLLTGYDTLSLNRTRLQVYVTHSPAGTSVQNIVHYGQGINSYKFQKFDYGRIGNLGKYGQMSPPLYSLDKSDVPTALFWGGKDWLADPKDVSLLAPQIKNLIVNKEIPQYDHMDFVWGDDANVVVYRDVIAIMKRYSGLQ